MTAPAPVVALIWVDDLGADVVESHAMVEDPETPQYLTVCGRIAAGGHVLDPANGAEGWIYIDRACEACFPNQSDLQGDPS